MTTKPHKSYEAFLSERSQNPTQKYYDAIKRIEKEFRTQKSTYGANAEALHESGLAGSGYAAFLDANAKGMRTERISDAKDAYEGAMRELRGSYQSYLENEQRRLNNLERSVQKSILSSETVNTALALDMAKGAGLSAEHALTVAKRAVALNIEKKKTAIMNYIRKQMITPENAVLYGEAYGLPKETLEELRAYAEKIQKRGDEVDIDETLNSYPTITPD